MQQQPELIGLEAMTRGAIRFQIQFVIFALVFRGCPTFYTLGSSAS